MGQYQVEYSLGHKHQDLAEIPIQAEQGRNLHEIYQGRQVDHQHGQRKTPHTHIEHAIAESRQFPVIHAHQAQEPRQPKATTTAQQKDSRQQLS